MIRPKLQIMFGSMAGLSDCTTIISLVYLESTRVLFMITNWYQLLSEYNWPDFGGQRC